MANALAAALDAGDAVLELQHELQGRGIGWQSWFREWGYLPLSTAKLYAQLAAHRSDIEAERARVPELSLRAARRLISTIPASSNGTTVAASAPHDASMLWAHLSEALKHLGALPRPQDTVEHVRKLGSVRRIVDQQLPGRVEWLKEFLDNWNSRNGRQQKPDAPGDDIGFNSTSEIERLRARVDELEAAIRLRDIRILGVESELEELRASRPLTTDPTIKSEATKH